MTRNIQEETKGHKEGKTTTTSTFQSLWKAQVAQPLLQEDWEAATDKVLFSFLHTDVH